MAQTQLQFPIVGAFFRPPAQAVLDVLPIGAELWLEAEPLNPYDENAVKVLIDFDVEMNLPDDSPAKIALAERLPNYGYSYDELLEAGRLHLGYLPRTDVAGLRRNGIIPDEGLVRAEFCVGLDGKPQARWQVQDQPQD